jgi:hypothetical protein
MSLQRPALERRVIASLEAGRIPVLLGGCGVGRTSLLVRLGELAGKDRTQYLDLAACATTPERCLSAVINATTSDGSPASTDVFAPTAKAAFDTLLALLDEPVSAGVPRTFFIDEFLELRTFENFPGLRHVQREAMQRLSQSPNRFVLTSRFTSRAHRLLRDAPPRFEVMHMPRLDDGEVGALAKAISGEKSTGETPAAVAAKVSALAGGRLSYASAVFLHMGHTNGGRAPDPVAALAALMAPGGRLTALTRYSYELRLHRARGYGALKAILGVLAEHEPVNLTEIAHRLHRTPGSTKDYLSWLEDVDLLTVERKKYSFDDSLMRLYVRLYARATPPTPGDIEREVDAYATRAVAAAAVRSSEPSGDGTERPAEPGRNSGIIEID